MRVAGEPLPSVYHTGVLSGGSTWSGTLDRWTTPTRTDSAQRLAMGVAKLTVECERNPTRLLVSKMGNKIVCKLGSVGENPKLGSPVNIWR